MTMPSTSDVQLEGLRRKLECLKEAVEILEVKLSALCDCLEVEEELDAGLRDNGKEDRQKLEELHVYRNVADALKEMFAAKEWQMDRAGFRLAHARSQFA
jgi:chromatin segregation and condensation protein Rec8/ScpA/Scc1 (kleisin family)